jgi:ParB/RepB/Spo0J family partition protein
MMTNINISETFDDPTFNCRGFIAPIDVEDLKTSILQHGLLQPIVVQPYDNPDRKDIKYKIVTGHRRYEACKLLGHKTIPAIIRTDLNENQARTLNFIENLERRNLTIMQEARTVDKYIKAGYDRDEISKMINKSTGWIQIRIAALRLPEDIQEKIDEYNVTQEQIRSMAAMISDEDRYALMREIINAKVRGEPLIDTPKIKKKNFNESKTRTVNEIYDMQDTIREAIGNNLATRALGWAAGLVTTLEILQDLEEYAIEKGLPYRMPPQ